jgi:hypothetical protein
LLLAEVAAAAVIPRGGSSISLVPAHTLSAAIMAAER